MRNILFIFILLFSFNLKSNEIEIISNFVGDGAEIKKHYKVSVNYRGYFENGVEFDSSLKRKVPFNFQIGLKQVITGWDIGILGMKVGGKRTIKIPPKLAYGSRGAGDLIPANSTLLFDIEILNASPPGYTNINSNELSSNQISNLILIDIRTIKGGEKIGIIKGSVQIEALDHLGNLNPNFIKSFKSFVKKNDHVVFISNNGELSSMFANSLYEQLDYNHVYNLIGGIQNWVKEGRNLIQVK